MFSPRPTEQQRPTLSNFGCFLPRPPATSSAATNKRPLPSSVVSSQKSTNLEKAMVKGLHRRTASIEEPDGFDEFYGIAPKKQPRKRSSGSAGDALGQGAESKVKSSGKSVSTKSQGLSAGSLNRKRPEILSLNLGSTMDEPAEASSESPDLLLEMTSFLGSAFTALDEAIGRATVPMTARTHASSRGASSFSSKMSPRMPKSARSSRPSDLDNARLTTPRGVPVYSLCGQSKVNGVKLPEGVQLFSLASPDNSPVNSPRNSPTASQQRPDFFSECEGDSNPNEAPDTSVVSCAAAEKSQISSHKQNAVAEIDIADRAKAALAARKAIPRLALP